jgi:RelA/SpoT family (p)ppGpp synthetase
VPSIVKLISKISTIQDACKILNEQIEIDNEIDLAINFAIEAHEGQFRKSGEPYVIHPILVAAIVASTTGDKTMTIAALLHDVVEDTPYTLEDIENRFGIDVAFLVKGLTKIEELQDSNIVITDSNKRLIKSALSFKNMLLTSTKDSRVLIIKLCDRLHNMMTLDAQPPSSQKRISEETLVVYTPIAHKLGMSKIKRVLEDLSFKYIYPHEYEKIDNYITSHQQDLNLKLNSFIEKIKVLLNQNGFHRDDIEIEGRVKHYYSIYLKMQRKGVSIEEVLDLLAVRVIVKEPLLCYKALGILHLNYTPIITRFKDYIALPKDNGYRTIHTTLFVEDAIIEAQIRTLQMHHIAECGIAAHWKYKGEDGEVKLDWIKEISSEDKSIVDFYESAKADLFSEEIVVFSPKGDKYTLPKGAVALDFAYAVHTEIGDLATLAYINKEKSSLLTRLKSSDIVNIVTDNEPRLHCSWIDAVKTRRAKDGIRQMCNKRLKEVNIKVAYQILATIFDCNVIEIEEAVKELKIDGNMAKVVDNLGILKTKIKQIAVYRNIKEVRFWELLKRGYKKPYLKTINKFSFYTNKSIDSVEFDFCCHPKLGDDIVAFYIRGNAVIHHKLCKKAYNLINKHTDSLFVKWNVKKSIKYRIVVALQNEKGALLELLKELDKLDLNIINIELGIQSSDKADYCRLEVETSSENNYNFKDIISKKFKVIDFVSLSDAYKN